jgi:hypothetical protein
MQNIIIYAWTHNGDLFHTVPFIEIIVSQNPNLCFTFYFYNSITKTTTGHYCLNDILKKYNNIKIGNYDITLNDKQIYNNCCNANTFYIDDCIYINLFSVQYPDLNGWDSNLINKNVESIWNLENRIEWLKYYKTYFKNITNINLNLDVTSTLDVMTLMPKLDKIEIDNINSIFHGLQHDTNIFFYNQYGGWDYGSVEEDNIILNYILTTYKNSNIITSKKTNMSNNNIYCVEETFNNPVDPCGKNLIVNAEIANLCNAIFFRLNGGSEFIFARNHVNNEKTEYIYIGNSKYLPRIHNLRSNVRHLHII